MQGTLATVFPIFWLVRMKIISSNIKEADYDRKSKQLTILFINRPRWKYTYYNVSPQRWVNFIKAKSKGEYFSKYIRDVYNFKKVI